MIFLEEQILNKVVKKLNKFNVCEEDVSLKNYCSMKVGGKARCIVFPKSIRALKKTIKILNKNKVEYFLLGNGTNVIFEDYGYNGVIVCLKNLNKVKIKKNIAIAGAGTNLFKLNFFLKESGLGGLEFTYGIPGSVGGAIYMNAGAYGEEVSKYVQKVLVFNGKKLYTIKRKNINFCYRNSSFINSGETILKVFFLLNKSDKAHIAEKQNLYLAKRKGSQPYNTYNCGSVFKNPEGNYAARLIEENGYKGKTEGGVRVSPKHANFIENFSGGKTADIKKLITDIKFDVKQKNNIVLSEEVLFIGKK